jgi:hypothetical protein
MWIPGGFSFDKKVLKIKADFGFMPRLAERLRSQARLCNIVTGVNTPGTMFPNSGFREYRDFPEADLNEAAGTADASRVQCSGSLAALR